MNSLVHPEGDISDLNFRYNSEMVGCTLSIVRDVSCNVKRRRDGNMVLRWTVTGLIEAERCFKQSRTVELLK